MSVKLRITHAWQYRIHSEEVRSILQGWFPKGPRLWPAYSDQPITVGLEQRFSDNFRLFGTICAVAVQ